MFAQTGSAEADHAEPGQGCSFQESAVLGLFFGQDAQCFFHGKRTKSVRAVFELGQSDADERGDGVAHNREIQIFEQRFGEQHGLEREIRHPSPGVRGIREEPGRRRQRQQRHGERQVPAVFLQESRFDGLEREPAERLVEIGFGFAHVVRMRVPQCGVGQKCRGQVCR